MMQTMRFRLDSAKWVTAALATILGLQVAALLTDLAGRGTPSTRATPRGAESPPAAPQLADSIAASGLFGGREPEPLIAPSSTSNLLLAGILAESDPRAGQAILAERGAPARVYRPGAMLPGGLRLHAVHVDHVVLERNGQLERLNLPRETAGSMAGSTSGSGQPIGLAPVAPSGAAALPQVSADPSLAEAIRWQAVLRPGMPSGVRVYPGADARAFTRLGLQAGDLIIALNDTPLADQANGEEFLRSLAGMPQASLTVERGGQVQKVFIDIAGLTPIRAN